MRLKPRLCTWQVSSLPLDLTLSSSCLLAFFFFETIFWFVVLVDFVLHSAGVIDVHYHTRFKPV